MNDHRAVIVDIMGLQSLVQSTMEPFFGVAAVVMNFDDIVQAVMENVIYDAYMARTTVEYMRDLGVPPERATEIAAELEQYFTEHIKVVVGKRPPNLIIRYDMLGRYSILVQTITERRISQYTEQPIVPYGMLPESLPR